MMKLLHKILLLVSLFLAACTSTEDHRTVQFYDEKILAAGVVENKLIVIGQTYSYAFEGKENIDAFSTIVSFEKVYRKRLTDSYPEIWLKKKDKHAKPVVTFVYRGIMPANRLSNTERQQLLSAEKIQDQAPFSIGRENNEPSDALYAWGILDGGQVISISNREEILQKFKFSQPFKIARAKQDMWFQTKSSTIVGDAMDIVVEEPASIIFLPFVAVGQLPLLLWALGN